MDDNEASGSSHVETNSEELGTVEYSQSGSLVKRLVQLECSVAISSYQSGLFVSLWDAIPRVALHLHHALRWPSLWGFPTMVMGGLTLAGGSEIVHFKNVLSLR